MARKKVDSEEHNRKSHGVRGDARTGSQDKYKISSLSEKEMASDTKKYHVKDVEGQPELLKTTPQNDLRLRQLDVGDMKYAKWRKKWWQMWYVFA